MQYKEDKESENVSMDGTKNAKTRRRNKDPSTIRNKQLKITITLNEYEVIVNKASEAGMTIVEFIVKSCEKYKLRGGKEQWEQLTYGKNGNQKHGKK